MAINRDNMEINDQPHLMYAEGREYAKPGQMDIETAIVLEGYKAKYIEIGYDDFQEIWSWRCDIER